MNIIAKSAADWVGNARSKWIPKGAIIAALVSGEAYLRRISPSRNLAGGGAHGDYRSEIG
jgi:hypothetical protein